jgi:hypothetical protein
MPDFSEALGNEHARTEAAHLAAVALAFENLANALRDGKELTLFLTLLNNSVLALWRAESGAAPLGFDAAREARGEPVAVLRRAAMDLADGGRGIFVQPFNESAFRARILALAFAHGFAWGSYGIARKLKQPTEGPMDPVAHGIVFEAMGLPVSEVSTAGKVV